jgi:hypothetical protein
MGSHGPVLEEPKRFSDLSGIRPLAEALHEEFGNAITCPSCPQPEPAVRAYCKDEGGKHTGGLKRRQFRCRQSVKHRKDGAAGCSIHSCPKYIQRAIVTIGREKVERVRQKVYAALLEQGRDTSQIAHAIRATSAPTTSPVLAPPSVSRPKHRSPSPTPRPLKRKDRSTSIVRPAKRPHTPTSSTLHQQLQRLVGEAQNLCREAQRLRDGIQGLHATLYPPNVTLASKAHSVDALPYVEDSEPDQVVPQSLSDSEDASDSLPVWLW